MTGNELKLELKKRGIKQEDAASKLGVTLRTLQNWFNRDLLDANIIHDLINSYGSEFIRGFTNEEFSEVLREAAEQMKGTELIRESNFRLVPLINIDAVGGLHKGNKIMNEPEYIVSRVAFNEALVEDRCIQVTGESMIPACPPGCIVLIREVKSWQEYFGFGNIFVILLKDGRRILKRITKSDYDSKNYIKCISINPEYPDEDLPKGMIVGVWKVIKILTDRGW